MSRRRCVSGVVATLLLVATTACSQDPGSLCGRAVSMPSFTLKFAAGLDNFSEDQYEQLRLESLEARDTLALVMADDGAPASAASLLLTVDDFIASMDDANWDVSVALSSKQAVNAAADLGSSATLGLANDVDVFVISKCGLPSTLAPVGETPETLPFPSVPSPTQTDPPASPPNQESEDRELGRTVAVLFGLTLSENQMLCLGTELQGVYDVSSPDSDLQQYQRQFQKAFDTCSVDFEVPGD